MKSLYAFYIIDYTLIQLKDKLMSAVLPSDSQLNISSSLSSKENGYKSYSTAKKIAMYLVGAACDLALLPGAGILALFACFKSNFDPKVENVKKDKIPILFIHGNGYNEMQWVFGRYLLSKNKDLGSMFSLNLDGIVSNKPENGIDDYAKLIQYKIEQIKKVSGQSQVILVGHSMGGLVASYYTENLKTNDVSVKKVIAISTPWSGSITLKFLTTITESFCPSVFKNQKRYQQMRGEENFLEELKSKALANSTTKYYSLYSTGDGFVSGNSGLLNSDHKNSKSYSWMGHYTPMVSLNAWNQVESWLKEE